MTRNRRRSTDVARIEAMQRRLHLAMLALPGVRAHLAEQAEDAATPGSGKAGSGISDPTAAGAQRIHAIVEQGRAIDRALKSIEDDIEHLALESERALGKHKTDTKTERRCTEMVLDHDGYDDVMRQCGVLSGYTLRPDGTLAARADGLCTEHGIEHDRGEQRRTESDSRRLRKHEARRSA